MNMWAKWVEEDQRFGFSDSKNGGVKISDTFWRELMDAQRKGKVIGKDDTGFPVITEPAIIPKTNQDISHKRASLYADPVTGSDKFFMEALRLKLSGEKEEAINALVEQGNKRIAEIQKDNPWSKE